MRSDSIRLSRTTNGKAGTAEPGKWAGILNATGQTPRTIATDVAFPVPRKATGHGQRSEGCRVRRSMTPVRAPAALLLLHCADVVVRVDHLATHPDGR